MKSKKRKTLIMTLATLFIFTGILASCGKNNPRDTPKANTEESSKQSEKKKNLTIIIQERTKKKQMINLKKAKKKIKMTLKKIKAKIVILQKKKLVIHLKKIIPRTG
ncbi:hypothetical protein AB6863_00630 [Carnobacterium maltaromaticum]|uniref:hypothetical protein n=1 Tax=Carnobacterium maltaromaticum TaxID=2751 RepID=UPI0039BDE423